MRGRRGHGMMSSVENASGLVAAKTCSISRVSTNILREIACATVPPGEDKNAYKCWQMLAKCLGEAVESAVTIRPNARALIS